ncbi:MAG: hypothetical protein KY434_02635 [Actinobacteria bacterium]|nr:hypothetical protein [Actinomycetota bacterium]
MVHGLWRSARRRRGPGAGRAALVALLVVVLGAAWTPAAWAVGEWSRLDIDADATGQTTGGWVRAIEQIGGVVYVGGDFTGVKSGRWADPVSQPYLAAFDASSGAPVAGFSPRLDGEVRSLATDGARLFVGGRFTEVNGQPGTSGLVALDPGTGALVPNWKADTIRVNRDVMVAALTVRGDDLYMGGDFSHITSRDGTQRRRYGLARVDTDTGALDGDWRPAAQGAGVRDLSIPPQGTRVYIGGIFPEVNNTPGTNQLAVVNDDTGALLPGWRNGWDGNYVYTVSSTNTRVYAGGGPHRLEVRDARDGRLVKSYWADGNLQSSEVVGDTLYFGGHFESPGVIEDGDRVYHQRNHVGALDMANGDALLPFYRDSAGPMGAWAIHGAPDGRLWYGGDVYRVGQGRVGGFARLSPVASRPGAGLYGRYFDDRRLQDLRWISTDQTVDFDWGRRGPNRPAADIDPPVGRNTFSVRWTGKVQPRFSGVYTFHTVSDDGVRLWVDGRRIINDWTRGGLRRRRGRIRLQAGQLHNIRLQYFEARGDASIRLLWSSDRQARQVIPRNHLYPQVAP